MPPLFNKVNTEINLIDVIVVYILIHVIYVQNSSMAGL